VAARVECVGTPERPHPLHALALETVETGLGVIIEAPQCSIACACCQRAGSLDHKLSSLFKPGIPGGELPD
jgi:hypothetical protein